MFSISPEIWGFLSVSVTILVTVPYVLKTVRGTNRPHIFTWLIWGLLAGVSSSIQYAHGAGSGAWSGFITTALCFLIVFISIQHGEKRITRSDVFVICAAIFSIFIWLGVESPFYAMLRL